MSGIVQGMQIQIKCSGPLNRSFSTRKSCSLSVQCRSGGRPPRRDSSFTKSRRAPPPPPSERQYETEKAAYEGPTDAEVWLGRLQRLPPTARTVALQQLLRIEEEGAFSGLVGGSPGADTDPEAPLSSSSETMKTTTAAGRNALDERARRSATEIVASVTRWKRKLAWILSNLPKPTRLETMDPPLRLLLLMGAYEILELGLAPHAVNDYVNLAKAVMHEGCGKVTNGVLRTLLRCVEQGTVPKPPPPPPGASMKQVAGAMGVAMSYPTWLVLRWLQQYGPKQTMSLMKCGNARPAYTLRLARGADAQKLIERLEESEGVSVKMSQYLPNEFLVVESGLQSVLATGLLKKGQGQVQDEAAGLVVAMLGPKPGEKVLDCCAAPGGKTMFAAARMNKQGRIVALDSSATRLKAVAATARAQGVLSDNGDSNEFLQLVAQDARQYCVNSEASDDLFDKVLLDAPCSGTGVVAKRADLRWRRQAEDMAVLTGLQAELLDAAAQAVRPGGLLVYSTCSLEAEENQQIIEKFLASERGQEFVVEAPPEGDVPAECLNDQGMLCMLPHVHGTDGAFAARLRRRG